MNMDNVSKIYESYFYNRRVFFFVHHCFGERFATISRFHAPKRLKSPQLRVDYRVKERKNRGLRTPRFAMTVHQ